jgi:CheY-like chemotaxis protein
MDGGGDAVQDVCLACEPPSVSRYRPTGNWSTHILCCYQNGLFADNPVDAVILDYKMEGMDGIAIRARYKDSKANA